MGADVVEGIGPAERRCELGCERRLQHSRIHVRKAEALRQEARRCSSSRADAILAYSDTAVEARSWEGKGERLVAVRLHRRCSLHADLTLTRALALRYESWQCNGSYEVKVFVDGVQGVVNGVGLGRWEGLSLVETCTASERTELRLGADEVPWSSPRESVHLNLSSCPFQLFQPSHGVYLTVMRIYLGT